MTVRMLGSRGVPGRFGGFETAAEYIGVYLVSKGWRVIVYCQAQGSGPITTDVWQGIERVIVPVDKPGWRGTSHFDWLSIRHACQHHDLCLTFGYNTGLFNFRQRMKGIPNIINMDGVEWKRARQGLAKQALLYLNQWAATIFGTHLIADHPEIERNLRRGMSKRRLTTIAYGARPVNDPPAESLAAHGLEPGTYLTLVARPIEENSILEIVRTFSAKPRGVKLAVLGEYQPEQVAYHRAVMDAASNEVRFLGPIYGYAAVEPLRYHSLGYLHGHTVGGTNPSLVEALAARNAIIAHDNPFNRWVAQDAALYFQDEAGLDCALDTLLNDRTTRARLEEAAERRFLAEFTWDRVVAQYEELLVRHQPAARRSPP
ncbi:MAG: DUF1972 domain-containing protein [Sphingomonas sp.]